MIIEYKQAFMEALKKKRIIQNPFLLHSFISDLIANDIQFNKLLKIFFEVNKIINICDLFKNNSLNDSKKILNDIYKNKTFECSSREFVAAISPFMEIMYKGEYIPKHNKEEEVVCVVKKSEVVKANVIKENKLPLSKQVTPQNTSTHFEKVSIYLSSGDLNIEVSKRNEFKVVEVDKNGVITNLSYKIINKVLYLKEFSKNLVKLIIPDIEYKNIHVRMNRGNVLLLGKTAIKSKRMNISTYGSIFLNVETPSLILENGSHTSEIYLKGKYGKIDINSQSSLIVGNFQTYKKSKKYMVEIKALTCEKFIMEINNLGYTLCSIAKRYPRYERTTIDLSEIKFDIEIEKIRVSLKT